LAESQKEMLLPRARALYAEGSTYDVIAESLGVSARTVRRWAAQDRAAGRPWRRDAERASSTSRPSLPRGEGSAEALRARLRERLDYLVAQSELNPDDAKLDDRMLKLCRVLEHLHKEAADVDAQLEALERFTRFCLQNLSEDEMDPVRKAVRLFLDNLKEEHS